jgi:hypothetical protein
MGRGMEINVPAAMRAAKRAARVIPVMVLRLEGTGDRVCSACASGVCSMFNPYTNKNEVNINRLCKARLDTAAIN